MLARLPESRRRRERRLAGIITSAIAHAVVILTVVATASAGPPPDPDDEVVVPLPLYPPEPPRPDRVHASRGTPALVEPRRDGLVLRAPVTIDIVIPPVEHGIPEIDYTRLEPGPGARSGSAPGAGEPGAGGHGDGGVLTFATVEKPVLQLPTPGAVRYPTMLRGAAFEGDVNVRFVVDTTGRVEPGSLVVLASDHELFSVSVRAALPSLRFIPAQAGGRKVRQLVEQRFVFELKD